MGETDRRVIERVLDHNKQDKKSHTLKHSRDKLHTHIWEHDLNLLGNNYQSNIKWKISEPANWSFGEILCIAYFNF